MSKKFADIKNKEITFGHMNWGPFVYFTKFPDYITKKLLREGKQAKDSYNHALAGHLNHQYLYPQSVQEWFYKEIELVISSYRHQHCKYHGIQNLNVEFRAHDLWVNFMKPGDFNPVHTHSGDYSFVYFLDVPNKLIKERDDFKGTGGGPGCLNFEYGLQQRPKWCTTGVVIKPETGDFYMFPALLQHWVAPFKSNCTRISVSGNLSIANKSQLPNDYF